MTLLKEGVSVVWLQGREGSVTILDGRCEALEHAGPSLIAAGAAKAQRESARAPRLLHRCLIFLSRSVLTPLFCVFVYR